MNERRLREEQRAAIEFLNHKERAMANRCSDALAIQQGACNPVAVTKRLHDHVQDMFRSGISQTEIRHDPALRLIVHQLAFLFRTSSLDGADGEYDRCIADCRKGEAT